MNEKMNLQTMAQSQLKHKRTLMEKEIKNLQPSRDAIDK